MLLALDEKKRKLKEELEAFDLSQGESVFVVLFFYKKKIRTL